MSHWTTAKLDSEVGPDWPRLLNAGDTLALYMGAGSVAEIRTQLLANDVRPELPVAFVENGTTQQQRTFLCSVASMQDVASAERIQSPTIIYIGEAINAAENLQWFEGQSRAREFPDQIPSKANSASRVDAAATP